MFYTLLIMAFSPLIVFCTSVFFFSANITAGDEAAEGKNKDSKHVVILPTSPDQKPQNVKNGEIEESDDDHFKSFELAQNFGVCPAGEVCLW